VGQLDRHNPFHVPPSISVDLTGTQAPDAQLEVARVGLTAWAACTLRVGVTMSLHKLTAWAGYDYLTRQVAALDATEKGHTGRATYYTERGESPGEWIGSGMDGIDGLAAGDPVTAEQMRALFGCGLHPLAELRQQQLEGPDNTDQDFQNVVRLGGAVQDRRQRSAPVSARGGQAHRGAQHRHRMAGRRLDGGG
jgi:TrwC relaxase